MKLKPKLSQGHISAFTVEGGVKLASNDRLICGYNAARLALDVNEIAERLESARKWLEAKETALADEHVKFVLENLLPVVEVLLETAPSVCPNMDVSMLEEVKRQVKAAEEDLSAKAYDIYSARVSIEMARGGTLHLYKKDR
jgi:hypothetical protein